ncbi:DUF222 domain-containing protein [Nocardioides sp.]|uniref:HNH endonuclease signature motif containing protein n=1 Tax=Nocardioides sp. TaxID=35761 RepID=UPI0037841503
MSAAPDVSSHPVLAAAAAVSAAVSSVGEVDPVFMTVEDKAVALLELSRGIDRLEELRMRVLAASGDVADRDGARDAAAWLAHRGRRDRGECRRRLRLARALADHPQVSAGLRSGVVNLAQAEVVTAAVEALPDRVDADVRAAAEDRLVDEAARFGPRQLRVLGRRVLEVVAPEVAEDHEGRLLADEETRARRGTFLRRRRVGPGISELVFRGPDHVCDRLMTYLEALTNPRRPDRQPDQPDQPADHQQQPPDRRPYDQRMGAAFAAFLEAVDPARLPLHGGDATTVIVTVTLAELGQVLGVAHTGDEPLSAGEARRLACTAGIIPVVLGGAGVVLDAGRTRRLYSPTQRRALAVTQPTCRAEGCDIPAAWCEAHHAGDPWAAGGRTDLTDAALLCSHHHHRAHDHRYRTQRHADGRLTFHRRT